MADARGALVRSEKAIEQDHHEVRKLLESLRNNTDMGELTDTLGKLAEVLALHFIKEEEPEGFLASLAACLPDHGQEVAELRREHDEMKKSLERLCRTIAQPGMNHVAVHAASASLLHQLGTHERREHELAQLVLKQQNAGA
jgi:hypothetical protein